MKSATSFYRCESFIKRNNLLLNISFNISHNRFSLANIRYNRVLAQNDSFVKAIIRCNRFMKIEEGRFATDLTLKIPLKFHYFFHYF